MAGPPAVQLDRVTAGYAGSRVLRDLSFEVAAGELLGAVGPSGSGKTTLLRLLTGQAEAYAGRVTVFGQPVRRGRPTRRIGYVPQLDTIDWDFPVTVEQVVLLGLTADSRRVPWFSRAERAAVHATLERLGLSGLATRHIRELSGGQQQRMFLARAMARQADLILLDEPTSGVDLATRHDVLHLLGDLNAEGVTILLTTHDLNWVAAHLPRVLCLNRTIVGDGHPVEVFTPDVLRATYGAEVRVIRQGDLVFVADQTHVLGTVPPGAPDAGPDDAGSDRAGSDDAGSDGAGSDGAGSSGAGSAGAGSRGVGHAGAGSRAGRSARATSDGSALPAPPAPPEPADRHAAPAARRGRT